MGGIFEADADGFRAMNAGRPAAHLVRELVQNVFDEVATEVRVRLDWDSNYGATLEVVDDVPGGIRDPALIFTLWLSDKQDSPTKRGRFGRGMKELISVADKTLIVSQGCPAQLFQRHRGGRWERSSPTKKRPKAGSVFLCQIGSWLQRDVRSAIEYLRRIQPPEGVYFEVNGEQVRTRAPVEVHRLALPTVVYVEEKHGRAARERTAECAVQLLEEPEHWVYEMGIPIELIEYPFSIDVGQRVPLREKRDTLTEPYRRRLLAALLEARIEKTPTESLRDSFVLTAIQAPDQLSEATKRRIAEAWTGGAAYATSKETFATATGYHVPAITLRSLPEPVRGIVREVGRDAAQVLDEMQAAFCSQLEPSQLTAKEAEIVRLWEWIAAGIRKPCAVQVFTGKPSCSASFHRASRRLSLYREVLGREWFELPLGSRQLALLIHELAHWTAPDDGNNHGFQFHSDAEQVGGAIAAFLALHRPPETP